MQQVKRIMDKMDAEGRGIVPKPGQEEKTLGPDGKLSREERARRKARFMERLYGPLPETARRG